MRKRKGLLTLSVLAFFIGLCYVVLVQPPLLVAISMLGVALGLCLITGMKGV